MIGGTCDGDFEPVRAAFAENFTLRGETGAAIFVTAGGRVVVDLCGGWTSAARVTPWQADTLVNIFSVGKGVACAARGRAGRDRRAGPGRTGETVLAGVRGGREAR